MKIEIAVKFLMYMWPLIRIEIAKAVGDPNTQWDDLLMETLDSIVEVIKNEA